MEEQEQFHIQERDIIAILNGQWHKTKNQKLQLHGLLLNTVLILMRDLLLLMEKQELSLIQEKVSIAILNGH